MSCINAYKEWRDWAIKELHPSASAWMAAVNEVKDLRAEIAELRKDQARLDHADWTMYFDENGECGWYISRVNHGCIRHEIDMAMQEGGES